MPAHPETYLPSSVAAVRNYEKEALAQLGRDYQGENPLFVFEALTIYRAAGEAAPPDWAMRSFTNSAASLMQLLEKPDGHRNGDEPERLGRALGFGKTGPGRGGWFEGASLLKRDRAIYLAVKERLVARKQLTAAYEDVAESKSVSRSTVCRAYRRIKKLTDTA